MSNLDSGSRAVKDTPVSKIHFEMVERSASLIALDNGRIRLVVVPATGAKNVSLLRIGTGREFLLPRDQSLSFLHALRIPTQSDPHDLIHRPSK